MAASNSPETVLVVDDDEPVRRTLVEWLEGANLGCTVLTAADAESALVIANQNTIDLAILDWNLGAGNNGLQLLEDLYLFNRDVVAVLVTGYAHQATPLDAMRMGVRDYLDKNQALDRKSFLAAVRRQLDLIRPARRQRILNERLAAFREAVQKVMPLVESAAALNDPVPLSRAVQSLLRFLLQTTAATAGVLIVRDYDPQRTPQEICRVYGVDGQPLVVNLIPFARSAAASVLSLGQPSAIHELEPSSGALELQPFERGHRSMLAAPVLVSSSLQAVVELFDKASGPFDMADQRLAGAVADFAAELLRQSLSERQAREMLVDAVGAALGAADFVTESMSAKAVDPPPAEVLDTLREGLRAFPESPLAAEDTLRLAEAIRVLALHHGRPAVEHCTRLLEDLRRLLDAATGSLSSAATYAGRP